MVLLALCASLEQADGEVQSFYRQPIQAVARRIASGKYQEDEKHLLKSRETLDTMAEARAALPSQVPVADSRLTAVKEIRTKEQKTNSHLATVKTWQEQQLTSMKQAVARAKTALKSARNGPESREAMLGEADGKGKSAVGKSKTVSSKPAGKHWPYTGKEVKKLKQKWEQKGKAVAKNPIKTAKSHVKSASKQVTMANIKKAHQAVQKAAKTAMIKWPKFSMPGAAKLLEGKQKKAKEKLAKDEAKAKNEAKAKKAKAKVSTQKSPAGKLEISKKAYKRAAQRVKETATKANVSKKESEKAQKAKQSSPPARPKGNHKQLEAHVRHWTAVVKATSAAAKEAEQKHKVASADTAKEQGRRMQVLVEETKKGLARSMSPHKNAAPKLEDLQLLEENEGADTETDTKESMGEQASEIANKAFLWEQKAQDTAAENLIQEKVAARKLEIKKEAALENAQARANEIMHKQKVSMAKKGKLEADRKKNLTWEIASKAYTDVEKTMVSDKKN